MTEQPWQSWEVLLLTASPESFLMLFVDARIDERTQRILCHSRNNAVIYWGNGKWKPMNCLFCDEIQDFFSSLFYKLTKRRSHAADQMSWVLSHLICWCHHWSSNWTYFASLQEGSSNWQNQSLSGTKSTNSFVIRFQICSLLTRLTRCNTIGQVSSFLYHFLTPAWINQSNIFHISAGRIQ